MPEHIPLVSIAIPVYNRENLIRRAIDSVLEQTMDDFELIISDNCSTDKTWDIVNDYVQRDSRIHAFRTTENIGPVRNWKNALCMARGEYFKFIWSDDWIAPNFIEATLNQLMHREDIAFAFSPTDIVSETGTTTFYEIRQRNSIITAAEFYYGTASWMNYPLSPGCALFRRKDVDSSLIVQIPNVSGIDFSRFGAGNDLLMFLMPLIRKRWIAFVHDTRAFFLSHSGSFSMSNDLRKYYDYAHVHFIETKGDPLFASRYYLKIKGRFSPESEILLRVGKVSWRLYIEVSVLLDKLILLLRSWLRYPVRLVRKIGMMILKRDGL